MADAGEAPTERTLLRARALGITPQLGERFLCVLDGHGNGARLERAPRSVWKYRCDGDDRDAGRLPGLAHVRALVAYARAGNREPGWLSATELARWGDLLDHEAGLYGRQPLDVPLPDGAPRAARLLAPHLGRLVGLRDPDRWTDGPLDFVFSRGVERDGTFTPGFGCAYSGLSDGTVRDGLRALERLGVIERAGQSGRAVLWRLRLADVAPVAADAVERAQVGPSGARRQEVVRPAQPAAEFAHERVVAGAESVGVAGRFGAAARGAGGRAIGTEHGADATPSAGGSTWLLVDVLGFEEAVIERLVEEFHATEITEEDNDA